MRTRIRARFAQLHGEREQAETQLAALAKTSPQAVDPTLLDQLPMPGGILPGLTPELKAELFQAFDLQVLWNKPGQQATVFAEITEATLQALPGILAPGRDGYDDTTDIDSSGHCPNVPWFSGPGSAGPTAASFAAARPPLHAAGFTYPLLTLRESASAGNIAAMAAFCARAVGNGPQSFAGSGEGGLDR